jgi:L-ascorbate metabolism protein UlaG (beta-lactamase superfamily)
MIADAVTWLGHSTVLLEVDGARVLTDPLLRRRVAHLRRTHAPTAVARVDGVLVSHLHYDHLDIPSLRTVGRDVPVVIPRGAGRLLRLRGFRDVREVEAGDVVELEGLQIRVTHAEHAASWRPGSSRATRAVGFVPDGVYFAGDTDLFDGMADIRPVDVALLPVAGWGPRLPAGHMSPELAAQALTLLRPRLAIPIHWGTFAPWRAPGADDAPAQAFARAAAEQAPEVEVRILRPGERCELTPQRPPSTSASGSPTTSTGTL